jgi:endoglucanase
MSNPFDDLVLKPLAEALSKLNEPILDKLNDISIKLDTIQKSLDKIQTSPTQPTPPAETPSTETPPVAETPPPIPDDTKPGVEPAPETFVPFTLQINNFDGKPHWENGVYVAEPIVMVSVPKVGKAMEAFKEGATVKLFDGKVRKVTKLQEVGSNLSVALSGPALDPAQDGYPNNLTSVAPDATDDPASVKPAPEPAEPTPPKTPPTNVIKFRAKRCVNLGLGMGGDGPAGGLPGRHMQHYRFPQLDEWKKVADDGVEQARVGFLWERAFPGGAGKGRLDQAHLAEMHKTAAFADQVGCMIIWDMHNYSGYSTTNSSGGRKRIGSAEVPINALGDDWKILAAALMENPITRKVTYGFDIMNEPIIPWSTWKPAAQHTVTQIASVSDKIVILEGIAYSNTTNWVKNNPGMETIVHPLGKEYLEFQGHLYLDNGQDGFWTDAVETKDNPSPTVAEDRMRGFVEWGRKHGLKLAIGETMVPGIYPKHVAQLAIQLRIGRENGIDMYPFFTAHGAGSNWHNIYKPENAPSLKVIREHWAALKQTA